MLERRFELFQEQVMKQFAELAQRVQELEKRAEAAEVWAIPDECHNIVDVDAAGSVAPDPEKKTPPPSGQRQGAPHWQDDEKGGEIHFEGQDGEKEHEAEECDECNYQIQESVWDVAIFIGTREVGLLGSIFASFLLLVNAAMQFVLCLIIEVSFTTPDIDESTIEGFKKWRYRVAHDVSFINANGEPLSHQVCSNNAGLPMSSGIRGVLSLIEEYLPISEAAEISQDSTIGDRVVPYFQGVVGQLLCVLAISIWCLTLLRDVRGIIGLGGAIWNMDSGPTCLMEREDGSRSLRSISRTRKVFNYAILTLKAWLDLSLLNSGTLFLIYTISLGELLLNCVALEIVLTLDEIIYGALTPRVQRNLVQTVAPLPRRRHRRWLGLEMFPVIAVIVIAGWLLMFVRPLLSEQAAMLDEARSAICGGNVSFVVSRSGFGHTVYAHWDGRDEPAGTTSSDMAVLEVMTGSPPLPGYPTAFQVTDISGSRWSVESMATAQITGDLAVVINPFCGDIPLEHFLSQRMEMGNEIDGNPIGSCADVTGLCGRDSQGGNLARMWCPQTCGCGDILSQQVLTTNIYGCPSSCSSGYHQRVANFSCSDSSPTSTLFTDYLVGLERLINSWGSGAESRLAAKNELGTGGCPVVQQMMTRAAFGDLCSANNLFDLKPMSYICPDTCGCSQLTPDAQASAGMLCPPGCHV
jgi:hypothetical protein